MFKKHPEFFQNTHIEYPIYDLDLNFSDYIAKTKKIIAEYRTNPWSIEANSPFEYKPTEKPHRGALLIHGLFTSPFVMQDIGKVLQQQGLLVRSILLPGHGTIPGALLNVRYQDWIQTLNYGIASLQKEVQDIFLVGFSTGANLCYLHALTNPTQVKGLILLAPAFKIRNRFDFLTKAHCAISWAFPRAKWFEVGEEIDETKYSSIPYNALYQLHLLTKLTQSVSKTKLMETPLLIALSEGDRLVSTPVSLRYFAKTTNDLNRLILYSRNNKEYADKRIIIRHSHYPEFNIKDFSHFAMPNSPDNPHYGKQGDIAVAFEKENKNYVYGELTKTIDLFYKVLLKLKLTHKQLRRLTYNPDFAFLSEQVAKFLMRIG